MFFTRIATLVALLLLAFAAIQLVAGYLLAFGTDISAENQASALRFLGAAKPGEVIDEAVQYLVFAVGLGTLAEISRHLARND